MRASLPLASSEERVEQGELIAPPDEWLVAVGSRGRGLPHHEPSIHGAGNALQLHVPEPVENEVSNGVSMRPPSDDHSASWGDRLQTRGDRRRLSRHEGLGRVTRRRDHLASVDPDPQGELFAEFAGELPVQLHELRLHRQSGAHSALGVVLVRHRRAEDPYDRVADELLDGPSVPVQHP